MPYSLTLTTADNAETIALSVPTKWADVTMEQFVHLLAHGAADRTPVEILGNLPDGLLERLSVKAVDHLATLLAFLTGDNGTGEFVIDPAPVLELLPTPGLPDIGSLPYGTLVMANQYIGANPGRPDLFYMPRLLALYRVQMLYGKYIGAKVTACEEALLASPVTEVYPDAAFFLASYHSWRSGTPPTQKTPPTLQMKKLTLGPKSLRPAGGRFSRWMRRLAAPS